MRFPVLYFIAFCCASLPWFQSNAFAAEGARLPAGIVASVNGIQIPTTKISDRLWRESGSVTLDHAVTSEIVRQEARKQGITVSPDEIHIRIAEYKAAFMSAAGHTPRDWELFIKRYGMAEIERRHTDDLLAMKLGEAHASQASLTDAERARVQADLARGAHKVHARIILVGTGREFDGRPDSVAKARAEEALAKIAGGTAWTEVCTEYSDDVSTRPSGGDLGFVTREQVEKPLEDILFTVKSGPESRQIVHVKSGYVVAEALGRKDEPPTEEIVRKAMEDTLKRKKDLAREVTTWFPVVAKSYRVERLLPYRRTGRARNN